MIQLITPPSYGELSDTLVEMHRLRHRVFKLRMAWEVETSSDMEIDEFDALHPDYLIQVDESGQVHGSVRLLPTLGPTMLRDTFPALLEGRPAPSTPLVWESSRFATDVPNDAPKGACGIALATYELFAGMVEFGLSRQLTDILTVTDVRMERILRRSGWPLRRICNPSTIGNTLAVAGYLDISRDTLASLRKAGGLSAPVLWTPVISAAA
ncbi:N-acyl-L-homoserine lactone synthetase [Bradyrhizobium japonicum]|uniref:acyl-homoserine-lactone synthase n=1 Tax=Bradyrhizobium elkanii TaxID=29448 RepID=UPI00036AA3BD|nr:acyl-homoserine-lactone synthase [Bradyrhizobium elkanii]MCP1732680.1 acyl homoserine lactone synthase [Bradyrhizobium elkanii]MCS3568018.1 acyl homoserine lactone synthase [Bradyrhizobium elkanii]MCS3590499.1 acyl homoserine lactone synthase [Bradyrhizobium elkanii]MCS3619942.1 acyl homoserine lactone synthase [Bradyrhizobium elkanii]MCW2111808.1 acyl homoserine lactone synthase [Bradyrhizobium elkanii]